MNPDWVSVVGVFFGEILKHWMFFLGAVVLIISLLSFETMVLRRKASRTGYVVILASCLLFMSFAVWQDQHHQIRDDLNRLQASDTEKDRLSGQVDKLSKFVEQQDRLLTDKSNALVSIEAQYQTAQRALAVEKEKYRSTYARARLASLRAEGLRLSQKVIANPNEPMPDWEFDAWSQATERTLYTLFHREQIQDFNAARKAALTYMRNYYDDYLARSGGVLMEEEFKEFQSRLIALYISVQVATLEKFSRNLNSGPLKNDKSIIYWQELITQNR
ncbi:MAG: hypothetical protein WBK08_12860 [Nitrospira sp.]|nr:MAG: hypothetical protein E8D42_11780 [Nitrospira sp.]